MSGEDPRRRVTLIDRDVVAVGIVELLPDGVVVCDHRGRLRLANRRAEELTGARLRDAYLQPVTRLLPLHDREHRSWWEVADPWRGLSTRSRIPEQLVHVPDGPTLLLSARFNRLPDRRLDRFVLTLRDARQRQRSETDTATLVSTTAHELRAPLSSMRGFGRILLERWDVLADDQKKWMLEAIDHDARRLARLVGELLDLSRIDSGRLTLRPERLDLAALARARIDRLVGDGYDPTRFETKVQRARPALWADRDRLTQVVDNLLDNAVTHGAGTVTVTIGFDADEDGGRHVLTVADQGPGIPRQHREAAFTRFWQGSSRGGSGLGLSVVRGLVEAHGGRVSVDPGEGAVITARLPSGVPTARLPSGSPRAGAGPRQRESG